MDRCHIASDGASDQHPRSRYSHAIQPEGDPGVNKKWLGLLCVLALLATACGSRLDDDEISSDDDLGQQGTDQSDDGDRAGIVEGEGDDGPVFGNGLPIPCGERPEDLTGEAPADTPGVTADTIRIGVISDKASIVSVPTASIEESVIAFVDFCNDLGGINGRQLELETYDAKLFEGLTAVQSACDDGLFALVGSGAVQDDLGAQAMVDCGLVEVPAYAATAKKALSDNVVMPLPNPTDSINIGSARWLADNHPEAVKNAAMLTSPDVETAYKQSKRLIEAYEAEGFDFTYVRDTSIIQENYSAEAQEMKRAGVEYVTMVSTVSEVTKLLRDMKAQGFEPEIVHLGQQYYDAELLTEPAAEGSLVELNTAPFEEEADNVALQGYLTAYDGVDTNIPPSSLGVQAFSAGLLFATATKALGDDLTRDGLLAELESINSWDGGGLHFMANPGENLVSTCFMFSTVSGGVFERLHPDEDYDCDDDYAMDLQGDYGTGATR